MTRNHERSAELNSPEPASIPDSGATRSLRTMHEFSSKTAALVGLADGNRLDEPVITIGEHDRHADKLAPEFKCVGDSSFDQTGAVGKHWRGLPSNTLHAQTAFIRDSGEHVIRIMTTSRRFARPGSCRRWSVCSRLAKRARYVLLASNHWVVGMVDCWEIDFSSFCTPHWRRGRSIISNQFGSSHQQALGH
jgi:hypothetical protein